VTCRRALAGLRAWLDAESGQGGASEIPGDCLLLAGVRVEAQRIPMVGDVVPVAVHGDGPSRRGPAVAGALIGGLGSKRGQPRRAGDAGPLEDEVGTSVDESLARPKRLGYLGVTDVEGCRDQPADDAGRAAAPGGQGGVGQAFDAGVQKRGEVTGAAGGAVDQPRQGRRERESVGVGAAKRGREGAVGG
jgi:hypothetical protein